MGAPGRRHRDRDRRLRVAGLDEPLNNLSSNHAEQDRDREEQPFRLRVPRVRLFPLGRVRLLILLLVRLHAPSYTKRKRGKDYIETVWGRGYMLRNPSPMAIAVNPRLGGRRAVPAKEKLIAA